MAGSLEAQHALKKGSLVSLSEQNLMDCSGAEGNDGCEGGEPNAAFVYIEKNNGIDTEESYPYEAVDDACRFKPESVAAHVAKYTKVASGDEQALTSAIATQGPISVGIDASRMSFHFYFGGVYYEPECSTSDLDHAVLAVGYGNENGHDYYIVKNSWGEAFRP